MSDERDNEREAQVHDEPVREWALGERLRRAETRLYGEAPDDIRAAVLRARLVAAARPALARRSALPTRRRSWWEYTAGWGRAAIPAGIAAAIAATLLVVASRSGTRRMLDASSTTETSIVTMAVRGVAAPEVAEAVVGPATREWLLTAAFASSPVSSEVPFVDSARR